MKRRLAIVLALSLLLAGCGGSSTYPRFSDAGQNYPGTAQGAVPPLHPVGPEDAETQSGLPPQHYRAQELQMRNPNAVGWLYIPDTGIDEVIMYHPSDNGYYLYRGFDELYSYDGMLCADYRSTFGSGTRGELAKNTAIYGTRSIDGRGNRPLTQLQVYLDPAFAAVHPYLFFSTTAEDMAWEVFAVCFSHVEIPFNRWDISDEKYARMLELITEASVYEWGGKLEAEDKILTLCTGLTRREGEQLTGHPDYYRFVVMARLVPMGEALKTMAELTPRPGPAAVAVPDWIRDGGYDYVLTLND